MDTYGVYGHIVFQFTPLREGRHSKAHHVAHTSAISIHAPPRGATDADVVFQRFHEFQFTPLREGRPS